MGVIILTCRCGQRVKAPGARPGRIGRCPTCGSLLEVVPEPIDYRPMTIAALQRSADLGAPDSAEDPKELHAPGGYFIEPIGTQRGSAGQQTPLSRSSPYKRAGGHITDSRTASHVPVAGELLPVLRHPETSILASMLYPLRGAETLAMVAVMSVIFWGFTILVPEYCMGIWADASTLGTPSMGMLVILISALPVLLLLPLVIIYLLQYLGRVLVSSAMGDIVPPRTPDRNFDGLFSGLSPWLTWLVLGGLISLSPLALFAFLEDQPILEKPLLIIGLVMLGLPYALTSLMLAFLNDRPSAAAPHGVLFAWLRHGRLFFPVLLQSSAIIAMSCMAFVLSLMLRLGHFWLYLAMALGCWGLAIWMAIVLMRVLGLHYHRHFDSLKWQRADPRWGVRWRL
jgi:hypothetical protein